eukprot:3249586-Rhodomonas_salina.2
MRSRLVRLHAPCPQRELHALTIPCTQTHLNNTLHCAKYDKWVVNGDAYLNQHLGPIILQLDVREPQVPTLWQYRASHSKRVGG